MSWLYEHRVQLDRFQHFAEIAYRATYGTRLPDKDDLEQDIVIALIRIVAKQGDVDEGYLWGVARTQIKRYWSKKSVEARRTCPLYEDSGDNEDDGQEMSPIREDLDIDSRLDAIAVLSTLPKRMVEIGYKRLNGEKLNSADREYWAKTKRKLLRGRTDHQNGCHLSEEDKRRIVRLYAQGLTVYKIGKTMGKNMTTIRLYLYQLGLRKIGEMPP